MPDPTFAQPERRSFLVPILLALAALAAAFALAVHFYPATTINLDHIHTDVRAESVKFRTDSIVIGADDSQHMLFIASTVRVDNQLRVPIFVDDFKLTFNNPDGGELTAKALSKAELPNAAINFPDLKSLIASPLLRDTAIDPGKQAQGTLLFSVSLTQAMWDARKSAVVEVDVYHQPALYTTIPKP